MPERRVDLSDHLSLLFVNLQQSADAILRLPSDALSTRPRTSVEEEQANYVNFPNLAKMAMLDVSNLSTSTGSLFESSKTPRTPESIESLYASSAAHPARQAQQASQKRVCWVDEPITRSQSSEHRSSEPAMEPAMSTLGVQRFRLAVAAEEKARREPASSGPQGLLSEMERARTSTVLWSTSMSSCPLL